MSPPARHRRGPPGGPCPRDPRRASRLLPNCARRAAASLVTIDRPERRTAVDRGALSGRADAIARAENDLARVLVLTGAGGHFCAGADLTGLEDESFAATLRVVLGALHDAPFPAVAAVEGAALGAGTQLAIACDLRVAAPTARFGIPAAKLGLM